MDMKELTEEAQKLNKYDYKVIDVNDKKYIISCTPMGFEDSVCNEINNALKNISLKLGLDTNKINNSWGETDIPELRDKFIEIFNQIHNIDDVIYGYEEF